MGVLMAMLKTLNDKVMEYGSAIASLTHEVKVLQTSQRLPVATPSLNLKRWHTPAKLCFFHSRFTIRVFSHD